MVFVHFESEKQLVVEQERFLLEQILTQEFGFLESSLVFP
jgi:hypothetical protein